MKFSNIVLKVIYAISLTLVFPLSSLAQEWTKIQLLKSNKEDVEKILGKSVSLKGYQGVYETKDGRIRVFYSDGICDYEAETGYKVPAWTALALSIVPQKRQSFREIIRDGKSLSTAFKGSQRIVYKDKVKNISYVVDKRDNIEYLLSMWLEPKLDSNLVCLKYEDNCFHRVGWLDIASIKETYKRGDPALVVTITESPRKYPYEFSWSLSEGEIAEGQNTAWIKIDTSKINKDSFNVKLTVKAKLPDGKTCLKIKEITINLQK